MWTVDDGSEGREQLFKAMDVIEKRREVREKLYHIHAVQRLISTQLKYGRNKEIWQKKANTIIKRLRRKDR
jgi:hypothetical protein